MATLLPSLLRSRKASWIAVGLLLAGLALPPGGLGIPLCLLKALTGIPCAGCGVTRAFLWTLRGRPDLGAAFHPAGVAAAVACAFLAGLLLVPARARERMAVWIAARSWVAWTGLAVLAGVVIAHLAARYVGLFVYHQRGPW